MTEGSSSRGRRWLGAVVVALVLAACGSPVPPVTTPEASTGPAASPTATATASSEATTPKPTIPPPTETSSPTIEPSPTDSPDPVVREQFGARAIAFVDASHGIVVGAGGPSGTRGVVRITRNGGRTWSRTITLASGPLVAVAVAGPHRAWTVAKCDSEAPAGCVSGIFRSDDGGASWARISSAVLRSPSFVDVDHGWAIRETDDPRGGLVEDVLRTVDGGRTWAPVKNGCPARFGPPIAVSFVDRLHGWLACNETYGAGGAAKGIAETVDGGRHWAARSGTSGDQGSLGSISWFDYVFALAMRPNGTGVWLGERGTTARTTDSGRRWSYGGPGDFDVDIASAASLPTGRTWFVVMWLADAQETALERSDDAGRHWRIVGRIGAP